MSGASKLQSALEQTPQSKTALQANGAPYMQQMVPVQPDNASNKYPIPNSYLRPIKNKNHD